MTSSPATEKKPSTSTKILLATSNPHKLEEVQAILPADQFHVLSLKDAGLDHLPEPVEDADTFEGNAEIKARYYAHHPDNTQQLACLADDSGLEVDALDGAPGVYSARYAGVDGPRAQKDLANNAKLIHALKDVAFEKRTARFVCALSYVDPKSGAEKNSSKSQWIDRGTFEGKIMLAEQADDPTQPEKGRGGHGFGYDPLFFVEGIEPLTTSAELDPQEKNKRSHRGAAVQKWLRWFCG